MTKPVDVGDYVDRMAELMQIEIAPEWRASVVDNMGATLAIAAPVLSFPLADHIEPAPVFEP